MLSVGVYAKCWVCAKLIIGIVQCPYYCIYQEDYKVSRQGFSTQVSEYLVFTDLFQLQTIHLARLMFTDVCYSYPSTMSILTILASTIFTYSMARFDCGITKSYSARWRCFLPTGPETRGLTGWSNVRSSRSDFHGQGRTGLCEKLVPPLDLSRGSYP